MFFSLIAHRFKHIIYVLGNHEHYNGISNTTEDIISEQLSAHKNITVAGNIAKCVDIDNLRFICGTLWTDYAKFVYDVVNIRSRISSCITDHRLIKIQEDDKSYRLFHPDDGALIHANTLDSFFSYD